MNENLKFNKGNLSALPTQLTSNNVYFAKDDLAGHDSNSGYLYYDDNGKKVSVSGNGYFISDDGEFNLNENIYLKIPRGEPSKVSKDDGTNQERYKQEYLGFVSSFGSGIWAMPITRTWQMSLDKSREVPFVGGYVRLKEGKIHTKSDGTIINNSTSLSVTAITYDSTETEKISTITVKTGTESWVESGENIIVDSNKYLFYDGNMKLADMADVLTLITHVSKMSDEALTINGDIVGNNFLVQPHPNIIKAKYPNNTDDLDITRNTMIAFYPTYCDSNNEYYLNTQGAYIDVSDNGNTEDDGCFMVIHNLNGPMIIGNGSTISDTFGSFKATTKKDLYLVSDGNIIVDSENLTANASGFRFNKTVDFGQQTNFNNPATFNSTATFNKAFTQDLIIQKSHTGFRVESTEQTDNKPNYSIKLHMGNGAVNGGNRGLYDGQNAANGLGTWALYWNKNNNATINVASAFHIFKKPKKNSNIKENTTVDFSLVTTDGKINATENSQGDNYDGAAFNLKWNKGNSVKNYSICFTTNASANNAVFYPTYEGNKSTESHIYLGSQFRAWQDIYSTKSSVTSTSDIRLKEVQDQSVLTSLLSVYDSITPISYKWKNKTENDKHDRIHVGLSSQEVEQKMFENGLTR